MPLLGFPVGHSFHPASLHAQEGCIYILTSGGILTNPRGVRINLSLVCISASNSEEMMVSRPSYFLQKLNNARQWGSFRFTYPQRMHYVQGLLHSSPIPLPNILKGTLGFLPQNVSDTLLQSRSNLLRLGQYSFISINSKNFFVL